MEHPYLLLDLIKVPGFEHYPHVTYTWVIMIFLGLLAYLSMRKASVVPNPIQNVVEMVLVALNNLIRDTMGEKGRIFMPLLVAEALLFSRQTSSA